MPRAGRHHHPVYGVELDLGSSKYESPPKPNAWIITCMAGAGAG
jgi:hypothetical protein